MPGTSQNTQRLLMELEAQFARKLPDRLRDIAAAWTEFNLDRDTARAGQLYRLVHQLAGSAASFGYGELGQRARALDERLRPHVADPGQLADTEMIALGGAIAGLCEDESIRQSERVTETAEPVSRLIYLIEDDEQLARIIALHLVDRGYMVDVLDAPDALVAAVERVEPSLVIVGLFADAPGGVSGPQVIAAINRGRTNPLPAVFLSIRNDLQTRLDVLRCGASVFLNKPLDFGVLTRQVDLLCSIEDHAPLRALLVDDDPDAAALVTTLEGAGFEVLATDSPREALERAVPFAPDVVLIDAELQSIESDAGGESIDISGVELAGVLRQDQALSQVPVGLIGADVAPDVARAAADVDAELFSRAVPPEQLVAELRSRTRRARLARASATRDSRPFRASSRSVQRIDSHTTVIEARRLSGGEELDEEGVQRLQRAIEGQLGAGRTTIIVDLAHVEHIDAAGLGYLVRLSNELPDRDGRLMLCGIDDGLVALMVRIGLDERMSRLPDRAAALEAAGKDPADPRLAPPDESGAFAALEPDELSRAQQLQRAMLPDLPEIPGTEFDVRYRPCSLLSGDFYDFVPLAPGKLAIAIGDVTGHGVTAALVMGVCKKVIKLFGTVLGSPREVLIHANNELVGELDGRTFISLVYGVLDYTAGTFEFARAGHEPLIVSSSRGIERHQPGGAALGLSLGSRFEKQLVPQTLQLAPGETLLMYTDGLLEAPSPAGEQFGAEGIDSVVRLAGPRGPSALVGALEIAYDTHRGGQPPEDDLTLLAFRLTG